MKKLMLMGAFMFSMGAFAQVESNQVESNQIEYTGPIIPVYDCYIYPLSTCDENGNPTGDMLGPFVLISQGNWTEQAKAEKRRIYCETGVIANDCPPK